MAFTDLWSLTVDHALCGTADTANYPLVICGTYPHLKSVANGGGVTDPSGHDICVFSDLALTTLLNWTLVMWDPSTGFVKIVAKVPNMTYASDYVCYLASGDAGITTFQGGTGGYRSAFQIAAPLPDGATLDADDYSGNGNHGTVTGAVAVVGHLGGGASFDGAGDHIDFGSASGLDTLVDFTIELLIKRGTVSTTTDQMLASKEWDDGSGFGGWWFYIRRDSDGTNGGKLKLGRGWSTSTFQTALWRAVTKLNSTSPWYHVAVTLSSSSTSNDPIFYVEGVAETTVEEQAPSGTLLSDAPYHVRIGEGSYGENDFNGYKEEFRLSNEIRSPSEILTSRNNLQSPSTFYALAKIPGTIALAGTLR